MSNLPTFARVLQERKMRNAQQETRPQIDTRSAIANQNLNKYQTDIYPNENQYSQQRLQCQQRITDIQHQLINEQRSSSNYLTNSQSQPKYLQSTPTVHQKDEVSRFSSFEQTRLRRDPMRQTVQPQINTPDPQIADLQSRIAALEKENMKLQLQLSQKNSSTNEDVDELKIQIRQLTKAIDERDQIIDIKESTIKALQQDYTKLGDDFQRILDLSNEQTIQLQKLRQQLSNQNDQIQPIKRMATPTRTSIPNDYVNEERPRYSRGEVSQSVAQPRWKGSARPAALVDNIFFS